MNLFSSSFGIFLGIILLLLITALFPLPSVLMITTLLGGGLIIYQAIIILKDKT